jgi:hypothetical protein
MRQAHSSAAFALAIVLLCVPASPQSVPSSQVSANDLARRVITNELRFQDDHTNWMYRLEKEQYGKKQVEEIIISMSVEMTGKALLFKSIGVQKRENRRDFHQVSDDLTLTQAADILNRHIVVADNR